MNLSPLAITEIPSRIKTFTRTRTADFWLFEASIWLYMFAGSLISLFIPILLLSNGFTLSDVLLFYVFFHALNIPANYLGRSIVRRYGARVTIILGTLLSIVFFVMYSTVTTWPQLLLLAFFYAVFDGLYYTASNYLFIGSTKDPENSGQNTGILHLVMRSAWLLGPIFGSILVLTSGGSRAVIVTASILFFIFSLIPLFFLKQIPVKPEHTPLSFKEFFNNKREVKNHLSMGLYKIVAAVEYIVFPIFIYLTFENLSSVAILAVLLPFVSLVFSYAASHIKRGQRENVIMLGAVLLAAVWIARIFIDSQIGLYLSTVFAGLFMLFILIPLEGNIFRRGVERGALSAAMFKNVAGMFFKLGLYLVLYIMVLIAEDVFVVSTFSFIFAACSLIILFMINRNYLQWRKNQPGQQTSVIGLPRE